MVVEVDSLVVDGWSAGAGVVTLLVVVEVEVDSFSLLQPANNTRVTKPAAIIALFFIILSYCKFYLRVSLPEVVSRNAGDFGAGKINIPSYKSRYEFDHDISLSEHQFSGKIGLSLFAIVHKVFSILI